MKQILASGENDSLSFFIKDDYCIKEFEIIIYDRWGEKILETSSLDDSWDGTYHGQNAHDGVYDYFRKTTLVTDNVTRRKRNITLNR